HAFQGQGWDSCVTASRSFSLLLALFLHLAHHLAHSCNMPWVMRLIPRLETLRRSFEMTEEALVVPHLAGLPDMGFHALPHSKELSGRFKEKVFVQQAVVEQRAGLLPVPENHHHICSCFGSHRRDLHCLFHGVGKVVLEEPVARMSQTRLA